MAALGTRLCPLKAESSGSIPDGATIIESVIYERLGPPTFPSPVVEISKFFQNRAPKFDFDWGLCAAHSWQMGRPRKAVEWSRQNMKSAGAVAFHPNEAGQVSGRLQPRPHVMER